MTTRSASSTKGRNQSNPSSALELQDKVRLHITPFNRDLLDKYISPSVRPHVSNISFHTVETFPEKGFGYVDMPSKEAEKLRKKLNGSILKGSKVRIEDARPEKRKLVEAEALAQDEGIKKRRSTRTTKKSTRDNVVDGIQLPEGRNVKRGWTETPSKVKEDKKKGKKDSKDKKVVKSLYTNQSELLLKTTLPANKLGNKTDAEKKDAKKSKRSKRQVVVHEFEKTQRHPSFLRKDDEPSTKVPTEYVEGKGWVDDNGDVVEAESKRKLRANRPQEDASTQATKEASTATGSAQKSKTKQKKSKEPSPELKSSSSESAESSPSSSDSSDVESDSDSPSDESDKESVAKSPSPSKATKPHVTITPEAKVHPLEALFKRAKPADSTPIGVPVAPPKLDTSFTFFNSDDGDGDEAGSNKGAELDPHTPFTRQDIRIRGIRSAAPTPDTAAIGKRFNFPWSMDNEDDDLDEKEEDEMAAAQLQGEAAEGVQAGGEGEEKEESEFAKWFWEHRGETNRAWKKRRRDAMKVKRQRDNRRMGRKVV